MSDNEEEDYSGDESSFEGSESESESESEDEEEVQKPARKSISKSTSSAKSSKQPAKPSKHTTKLSITKSKKQHAKPLKPTTKSTSSTQSTKQPSKQPAKQKLRLDYSNDNKSDDESTSGSSVELVSSQVVQQPSKQPAAQKPNLDNSDDDKSDDESTSGSSVELVSSQVVKQPSKPRTTKSTTVKPATRLKAPSKSISKPKEKRKVMEVLQVAEPISKRARTIERQVRRRMATAAADERDETFSKEAVEKTVFEQKSRSEAYTHSKPDIITMRNFIYDKGLVGVSQSDLLEELLVEIGMEEDEEVGIREKVKQKVSNLNRTRREFIEMIAEDDVDHVGDRLLKVVKEFGKRPGAWQALQKVKEAIDLEQGDTM
jgi:hypothetical protein